MVITLVVQTFHKGENHSCSVWEVVPDGLHFLPTLYAHPVEIAWSCCPIAQRPLFSRDVVAFQVLPDTDTAFEGNDGWSVHSSKRWDQAIW